MIKYLNINKNSEDQRLDKFLKRNFLNLTQSFIEKNIRKKKILVNNKITKSNYIVKINDQIIIKNYSEEVYSSFKKEELKVNIENSLKQTFDKSILYENENFFILDKWNGISTQGGNKISVSIDSIIKNKSSKYNLVHRLDKETSGLLIIAKNLKYTKVFGELFKSHKIKKTYLALCNGKPKIKESLVDLLINSKDKNKNIRTKTYYKLLSYNKQISLLKFEPTTGKKHQLRIVAKNLGCPIVGDIKYNLNKTRLRENLKLNACKLEFFIKNKKFSFESKLPKDFINFMKLKNIQFDLNSI